MSPGRCARRTYESCLRVPLVWCFTTETENTTAARARMPMGRATRPTSALRLLAHVERRAHVLRRRVARAERLETPPALDQGEDGARIVLVVVDVAALRQRRD